MKNQALLIICLNHLNQYPLMRVQDMVKLIYQHEFGAGHLLGDDHLVLEVMQQEYETQVRSHHIGLFDQVSPRLYRINLNHPRIKPYHLASIAKAFKKSTFYAGEKQSFKEKLDVIVELSLHDQCPWSLDEAKYFLTEYELNGYSSLSHSDDYKKAYHPSYRLVDKDFKDFFDVFTSIDAMMQQKKHCHIAIDGMCGSGKTHLATLLSTYYDSNIIAMDDFFLQSHQRTQKRLSEIGGNVDYVRFNDQVIKGLLSRQSFSYQLYDCQLETLDRWLTINPKPLTIIEGSYSMHPLFIDFYDLLIFLKVDKHIQTERIQNRNPGLFDRFINEWIPMENQYHVVYQLEARSDVVVNT